MSIESVVINVAFLTVTAFLVIPASKVLKKVLFSHSYSIHSNVESAIASRARYKELLLEIEKKNSGLDSNIEEILSNAKKHASKIESEAKEDIKSMIEEKLLSTQRKIEEYNQSVLKQIQKNCIFIASDSVKEFSAQYFDNLDQKKILKSYYKDAKDTNLH